MTMLKIWVKHRREDFLTEEDDDGELHDYSSHSASIDMIEGDYQGTAKIMELEDGDGDDSGMESSHVLLITCKGKVIYDMDNIRSVNDRERAWQNVAYQIIIKGDEQ